MTDERLNALAAQLRGRSIANPVFDEEYRSFERMETVERRTVETRHGETPVFIHRANDLRSPAPLFVNIHGGGFVRPLIETNVRFCAKVAALTRGIVADIDYRLAPEYRFPVALEECYDVCRWIFENAEALGSRPDLITLGGHSAGASLTASLTLMSNQTKDFRVGLQILDFGAFDMKTDPADKPDWQHNAIPLDRMRAFTTCYTLDDPEITGNPYVSPLFAPEEWFPGLPDALVITGGTDTFRFEGEQYALRMVAAGVKVTLIRYPDSPHGFTVNCVGKWREAQKLIVDTLNAHTREVLCGDGTEKADL